MSPVSPQAVPSPRRVENGKGLFFMALGMFLFSAVDTMAKFLSDERVHSLEDSETTMDQPVEQDSEEEELR